jgi:hypothetical protein
MALQLLFMAGASVVRAATPAIARYLAKQGLKRATGAAAKKPVSSTITSIKQAQKLKPSTKVVGKGPKPASVQTGAPKSPPKPLRADPKDRISTPAKKAKTTATGTSTQKKIVGAGLTAASLSGLLPDRKGSGKSQAKTGSSNLSAAQKEAAAKRRITQLDAREKRLQADSKRAKAAAKDKGKNFNVGVSRGGVSFNTAFAHFRKKGNKTFTWNGKKYTTELASEKKGKK